MWILKKLLFIVKTNITLRKCRLASVNEANSFRISQIPSQRSYSVSDVLAAGIVEVKTIRELVDCMEVINLLNYFSI